MSGSEAASAELGRPSWPWDVLADVRVGIQPIRTSSAPGATDLPLHHYQRLEWGGTVGVLPIAGAAAAAAARAANARPATGWLSSDSMLHLLRRATFGPTPGALTQTRALGIDAWIEMQL